MSCQKKKKVPSITQWHSCLQHARFLVLLLLASAGQRHCRTARLRVGSLERKTPISLIDFELEWQTGENLETLTGQKPTSECECAKLHSNYYAKQQVRHGGEIPAFVSP